MDAPPITSASAEETRRFNLVCAALALLWIAGTLFLSLTTNATLRQRLPLPPALETYETKFGEVHEYHDFSQFYMGGLIARYRAWNDLYPVPHADSINSPGEWEEADSRPEYSQLAKEAGVPEHQSRFIQPPPFAVMMQPLAYLKYPQAKKVWNLLMCLCAWGVALLAGRSLRAVWGRPTRAAGVVTLLVAISPLTFETLRLMNVTPLIALLTGLAIVGLLSPRSEGGAVALVVGTVSKYAPAVLLPLYIAMRKWSAIAVMIVAAAAICGGSYYLMHRGPFDTFWREMVPTFGRVHTDEWNRSLFAVLRAAAHQKVLAGTPLWIGRGLQAASLLAILWVLFTRPLEQWTRPASVFAAATCLLGWFLAFSPILWDHYLFYLAPLWGWLIWEARHSLWRGLLIVAALGYQSLPARVTETDRVKHWFEVLQNHHVPAPESILTLLSIAAIVTVAVSRLLSTEPEPVAEEDDAYEAAATALPTTFLTARHFNLGCYALAALFLAAFTAHHLRANRAADGYGYKSTGDFAQFYMGGVMARAHAWDDLYPVPKPTSINNPGMREDSDMRPRYAEEAGRRCVGDEQRFIQPPPVAVMLWPLSYLSYARAYLVWTALLAAAAWGVGWIAGQVYRELFGRETRVSGAMTVLVACSPLMLHAIDVANMTIFVGLLLGVAALQLARRRDVTSAAAITLGGLLKYATLALLPLAVAMRRWTVVAVTVVLAAAACAGTYALTKQAPFLTYARDIAPTLGRPHTITTNQSVTGLLMRLRSPTPTEEKTLQPLPAGVTWGVRAGQAASLLVLLWLMFRRPVEFWDEPANVFAAAAGLVCWLLIFAPIYWEHYPVYLTPFWAWLVWESRRSYLMLLLTILGVALMWAPVTVYTDLREPFNSHMLAGTLLMLLAALIRLAAASPVDEGADDPRYEVATPFETEM